MNRLLALFIFMFASSASYAQLMKIEHGPYLQNVEETEATIVWITDSMSTGWVEYFTDPNDYFTRPYERHYEQKDGIRTVSRVHKVQLKGLKPGTKYYYRAFSQFVKERAYEKATLANVETSHIYGGNIPYFITADAKKDTVSFSIFNDIHGDNELLLGLTSKCALDSTDFIIFNGDMCSFLLNEKQIFDDFMEKSDSLFADHIPVYYTRGNHETRGEFSSNFHDYFSPCKEHIYYTFRQGPVFFVVLDTGEDKPDSDVEYYGLTDYTGYRAEQTRWLESVLDSKEYQEAPCKVIIAHMPPTGPWYGNIDLKRNIMEPLRKNAPHIMFCGHEHRFSHIDPSQEFPYPIIINTNSAIVNVKATAHEMHWKIIDKDDKVLEEQSITY